MVKKTSAGLFASIYADRPYLADRRYDEFVTSRPPPTEPVPSAESKSSFSPDAYPKPYLEFMNNNPTVFHTVDWIANRLKSAGYKCLPERDTWNTDIKPGGKYYTSRNGSAIIAFAVGKDYKPGNGVGIVASHIDVLTAKLKPIPTLQNKAGFVQLGIAPYAGGGVSPTWWDRDLGIGGRVKFCPPLHGDSLGTRARMTATVRMRLRGLVTSATTPSAGTTGGTPNTGGGGNLDGSFKGWLIGKSAALSEAG